MRRAALLTSVIVGFVLSVLYACRDTEEPTQPSSASIAASYLLTISGLGTGNGVVTSSPTGINCAISGGSASSSGCSALFTQGLAVTLTAKPASGHSFVGWGGACIGLGSCKVVMSSARTVS